MTGQEYIPLLILPVPGLLILAVVWAILAVDRRKRDQHHIAAE